MTNTYTLKITGLTCRPHADGLSNVVTDVQFRERSSWRRVELHVWLPW